MNVFFYCFDCARDVKCKLNIKKIFSDFLKADENFSGDRSRKVNIDEKKESLSLENFLKLDTSNAYSCFSILQFLFSFEMNYNCLWWKNHANNFVGASKIICDVCFNIFLHSISKHLCRKLMVKPSSFNPV